MFICVSKINLGEAPKPVCDESIPSIVLYYPNRETQFICGQTAVERLMVKLLEKEGSVFP